MKRMFSTVAVAIVLLVACNQPAKTEEKKTETTTTTAAAPAAGPMYMAPYVSRSVVLTVSDFDKWYAEFIKPDTTMDTKWGFGDALVGRITGEDKKVLVMSTVKDVTKSKAWDNSKDRKDDLKKSGITNPPTPTYWNVVMDDTSHIPQMERVAVTVKVKDYDAWKKSFDAEGTATRQANGMVERAISRGMDDPNTINVLLAVTDMEKAKARIASPELKKIMEDGGVISKPEIVWFKWVKM